MKTEPLRAVLLPIVLAAAAASVQAFSTGADTRGIISAALGALVLAGQEYARSKVTPVAPAVRGGQVGQGEVDLLIRVLLLIVVVVLIVWVVSALLSHA